MLKEEKINDLISQFRCPKGERGIEVGQYLDQCNNKVTQDSIKALDLDDKNRILELGHGNGNHLSFLMEQAYQLKYFGMEISEVMHDEASRINEKYIKNNNALFQLYDGTRVPYVHNLFDRILTINTIYFWKKPLEYINEMFRVLKPGGIFVLAYTNSSLLEQLSLLENGDDFVLYNQQKIKELIEPTDFILESMKENIDRVKDHLGKLTEKKYTIVVLKKKAKSRYDSLV